MQKANYKKKNLREEVPNSLEMYFFDSNLVEQILSFYRMIFVNFPMKHSQTIRKAIASIQKSIGIELFAMITISVSQLIFPLSFLYVSQNNINPIYTNLSRGLITFLSHYAILFYFGIPVDVPRSADLKIIVFRCTVIAFQQLLHTYMYYVLSFSLISTLLVGGPLFVFIFDYLIFSVAVNKKQVFGFILGAIGVIITINGDAIMAMLVDDYQIVTTFKNYKVNSIGLKLLFSLIFVASQAVWAYSVILQKKVLHVNTLTLSLYMGIEYMLVSGVICSLGVVPSISADSFFQTCLYSGSVASLVQLMFLTCLSLSKHSGLLTMSVFLGILTSYLISHYRFGEKYNPIAICGMILLVSGIIKATINKPK